MTAPVEQWKRQLGARLKYFRERKGMSHETVAQTLRRTEAYIVRLETQMHDENPTLQILEQLVTLYGRDIAALFQPIVASKQAPDWIRPELHDKLEDILKKGPERIGVAISENIEGMWERARKLRKEGQSK